MRIGIDARLNAYRRGGIPEYTRRLLEAMSAAAPAGVTFVALQHRKQLRPVVVAHNVARRSLVTPPHNRWEHLALPLELLPLGLDLLHCPDVIAPVRRACPAVVTIHDLAFLRFPTILDDDARRYYSRVSLSTRHADGVIAVSEATRADIATLLDIDPARVSVIYEAADSVFQPLELQPGEQRQINGQTLEAGSFALFVSTLEPRKNLPTLLRALRTVIDRGDECRLVVVGARGWHDQPIFDTLRDLRLHEHVVLLGAVQREELPWLYNACRVFCFPSHYEGFGLPLLEALACGTAVIAANASSLPEIAGDAAVLLPPDDHLAWADTLSALWHDAPRCAELGRRGVARAAGFTWARAARETLALYRRAVGGLAAPVPELRPIGRRPVPRPAVSAPHCPTCGRAMERIVTPGRGAWACPHCDQGPVLAWRRSRQASTEQSEDAA